MFFSCLDCGVSREMLPGKEDILCECMINVLGNKNVSKTYLLKFQHDIKTTHHQLSNFPILE